jgi:hypothetical protein
MSRSVQRSGIVFAGPPTAVAIDMTMAIVILVLFLVLIVGGAIYGNYTSEQRRKALSAIAQRRGWTFCPEHNTGIEARFPAFACLFEGSDRYAFNVLEGMVKQGHACGFDYHYETESTDSKGDRTTHQHLFSALVLDVGLPLRPLLIRPETFFDKIGAFFGYDDIDFESDEFSRRFCVKAEERRWAFDVIGQATMEFLLAAPEFTIQFAGRSVMAVRTGVFDPDEFEQALAVVAGIIDRLPADVRRELQTPQK